MLNQIEEFSNEDFTFTPCGLFFTTPDMPAVAAFDERSDLLNGFALYLDDTLKMSLNARPGAIITKITYKPVTEDNMQTNVTRGFRRMETDESASGQLGGETLEDTNLFEDGDVSYAGAAGTHNADGLDLMPMPWGESPAKSPTKAQHNAQTAPAQRSGEGEGDLDLIPLF